MEERWLRVVAGGEGSATFVSETVLAFSEEGAGTTAADLGLATGNQTENVQQYSLGNGAAGNQEGAVPGDDGLVPDADALIGNFDDKTGIYALRDVDLFNIVCIPGAVAPHMSEPTRLRCTPRLRPSARPSERFSSWISPTARTTSRRSRTGSMHANIRHKNAAVYFPRPHIPDPLMENRLKGVGPSGTMAGVYARTDGARGVWKAPAGLEATLRNVLGSRLQADRPGERRSSTRSGSTACARSRSMGRWPGARAPSTAPTRWPPSGSTSPSGALALFIEESLYRGTQVGRVRAERRAALGADPAQRRRVHAEPVPPGRLPGHDARARPTSSSATTRRRPRTTSTSASSTSSSGSRR